MITIRDLSKRYDGNTVLKNIDLDVPTHTVTAIIGPSGTNIEAAIEVETEDISSVLPVMLNT